MKKSLATSALALALLWNPGATMAKLDRDVPYEPSPANVVARMLDLAEVGPDDVVYDLGSGDGRIVIAAAKRGARAVGVEIDPRLAEGARAKAAKEGVDDRTRFVVGDLFLADFSEATVVTLFLWPQVNIRLRPRLLNELTPGTRVVSHFHDMEDWEPDKSERVGDYRMLYLWVIPANAGGAWHGTLRLPDGRVERLDLRLTQRFSRLAGGLNVGDEAGAVDDGRLLGEAVRLRSEEAGGLRLTGRIEGDAMSGVIEKYGLRGEFTARRDPASRRPVEEPEAEAAAP